MVNLIINPVTVSTVDGVQPIIIKIRQIIWVISVC